jgi:formylglycine-generating enzyme required for sulfatase activity
LFSFGQKTSVPWKNVRKLSKAIPASYTELEHTVIQQNDGETIKTDFQENDTPTLKLKTCLGSLTIIRQNISALYIDQKSSKACLIATDGSHFVVPRPSRRQLGDLTGVEDYELPEQNCFTVNISPRNSNPSGAGTFACRLDDGSLLYGKLASQEITLLHGKDGHQKSTINNTSIKSISRNEDGKLIFNLKRGALVADPKQKSLLFTIDACSTTNKIAFKHIRNLVSSAAKLPPSTIFRPGLPAALKNEISVKGGSYMQGSSSGMDDEAPVHPVSLSSFLIDATEVTRAQFADFIRDTDYKTSAELSESPATWRIPGFMQNMNDPVVCVSWDDAVAYCNWRSSKAGLAPCYTVNKDKTVETDMTANGYRLPTEAEWEFAARSRGKDNLYACTTGTIEPAVLMANSKEVSSVDKWTWTNPVMAFPANQIGIYGMSGNAWEWCQDWYFSKAYASLQNREVHDPCIKSDDAPRLSRRVMRGGSFRNHREMLRCTSRGNGLPFAFAGHVGFRCVRNAPSSQ